MKSKIKFFVLILVVYILAGSFVLKGEGTEPVKILDKPHPFYDAQLLAESFKLKDDQVAVIPPKIKVILKVFSKYVKNSDLSTELAKAEDLDINLFNRLSDDDFSKIVFFKDLMVALKNYSSDRSTQLENLERLKKMKGLNVNVRLDKFQALINTGLLKNSDPLGNLPSLLTLSTLKKAKLNLLGTDVDIQSISAATEAKGFLQPAVVVDALASFISDRFKEELSIAYLNKFKQFLNENDVNLLFPTTCGFLTSEGIYNFKVFIPTLKQVFQEDFNNLGDNSINFLKKKQPPTGLNSIFFPIDFFWAVYFELKLPPIFLFWDVYSKLKKGDHPADVVENLSYNPYFERILSPEFKNYIRLFGLISRTLRDKDTNGWIKPAEFEEYLPVSSTHMRKIFIGLIYAKEKDELENISFNGKSLATILKESDAEIIKVNNYLHRIILAARTIQNQLKNMAENEKLGPKEYNEYLSSVLQVIKLGYDLKKEYFSNLNDDNMDIALKFAENLLAISKNIYDKAYGAALANALGILKDVFKNSPTINSITQYGTFMVSMVSAKDSEEVKAAISTAALPVGSYRIKRANYFTLSLNSYPGVFIGGERLTADKALMAGKPGSWTTSFTAPVGLDFSWGSYNPQDKEKPGPSGGFFISVIDIGAVVSLRLSGEDKGLPEFTWKNLLAPGIFFMYGFKNSPITWGFGIQYGPQLRKIKPKPVAPTTPTVSGKDSQSSENPLVATIDSSAFRFGVIITVDIPIFNLYTKEERKQNQNPGQ